MTTYGPASDDTLDSELEKIATYSIMRVHIIEPGHVLNKWDPERSVQFQVTRGTRATTFWWPFAFPYSKVEHMLP